MSGKWKSMSATQHAIAEAVFDATSTVDYLTEAGSSDGKMTPKIGFTRLFAHASGRVGSSDAQIERAIAEDVRLRREFLALLKLISLAHFPRVAAASGGSIVERQGGRFRIRLRRSRATPGQTYVIIELGEPTEHAPQYLFVTGPDGGVERFTLPKAQDGVVQILTDEDSTLPGQLSDPQTEVFLR